jgi:hypothetical protein
MEFFMEGKGDGCLEGNPCLKRGKQISNKFLASKILYLFEEVEGTLNAHGTGASRVDVPISTL